MFSKASWLEIRPAVTSIANTHGQTFSGLWIRWAKAQASLGNRFARTSSLGRSGIGHRKNPPQNHTEVGIFSFIRFIARILLCVAMLKMGATLSSSLPLVQRVVAALSSSLPFVPYSSSSSLCHQHHHQRVVAAHAIELIVAAVSSSSSSLSSP